MDGRGGDGGGGGGSGGGGGGVGGVEELFECCGGVWVGVRGVGGFLA